MLFRTLTTLIMGVVLPFAVTASPLPVLSSPLAVVQDAKSGKILFAKDSGKTVSMASLTKLMTAMVILDGPTEWLDKSVSIEQSDVDTLKYSSSRVPVGSTWTVHDLLHLMLMASDNRAAHALGRVYPGGTSGILNIMNTKAASMGLKSTFFQDTSGLNPQNQTTPAELAYMTSHAAQYPLIRQFSTDATKTFNKDGKTLVFNNTNAVVRDQKWPSIWVSKTGFTQEAGRCVTMMGRLADRDITVVLMAGVSSAARTLDIQRIQHWLDAKNFDLPMTKAPVKKKKSSPKVVKKVTIKKSNKHT